MSSISVQPLSETEHKRLSSVFEAVQKCEQSYVRTNPGNVVLPAEYENFKDRLKNWEIREDDVYVCAFPKNGSTWTQELVWLIQNDCDFGKAKAIHLDKRVPFLDNALLTKLVKSRRLKDGEKALRFQANLPSPRILKTHLQLCLLPDNLLEKSRVVSCLRNPKDTVISYFYHQILLEGIDGDLPSYFDLFMDNLLLYTSYFDYVTEIWKKRNHPNMCLLFYENMKKDLAANIRKVAKFLGKEFEDEKIEALVDHLSFEKMKNNTAVNKAGYEKHMAHSKGGRFMRKGEIGDWKNHFTIEMNKRMDEAIENYFKPIGLEFQYENGSHDGYKSCIDSKL